MGRMTTALLAFNRGRVSRLGLARVDVKRLAMSAADMRNFIPRTLGSMSIRPGWKYLGSTNGDAAAKFIPFVFSVTDTHLIELTAQTMRVWWADEVVTRETVGTGVTNGEFTSDLTGWTDADEAGATSSWNSDGHLQLLGDGVNAAIRYQEVTVAGGDSGVEHALHITVTRGPVLIRVGSVAGGEQYVREISLGTGEHSLAFTPTGNFFIYFLSRTSYPVLVTSVSIEAAGAFTISTPWTASDLDNVRWDQSGDFIFVACAGRSPRIIQRWDIHSWSVVEFEPTDGPFRIENTSSTTLTPSAISGSITLTASSNLFRDTHVGALFSLTSSGQVVESSFSALDAVTNAVRITGIDASRVFTIVISGTWTGTIILQRSLESDEGPWEDVSGLSWTANTTETYDDGLDNQIAWYRLKMTSYGSGTAVASIDYALGAVTGIVRITAFTSVTSVSAIVLRDLGGTEATDVWAEGDWSARRGYPTAVALHEGRLWWAGRSKLWGSVTDAFDSFDPDYEGDAGPISRSLGAGPVDNINWLVSSQRLLIGADLNEYAARSSSLDEPLTPTQFNVKVTSDQGSAPVAPVRLGARTVFVNRTGMKVYENSMNAGTLEYDLTDLCSLVPEIGDPKIVRMASQRQPDTRLHCVRSDGTVALLVLDKNEEVTAWCEIETDGYVEDAVVLPAQSGVTDDYVYYVVRREIDGATVRYLEKWAQASTTRGGLGLGGPSLLNAFTDFEFVQTDVAESYPDDNIGALYVAENRRIYVPGSNSDDISVHNEDTFTSAPLVIDGEGKIQASDIRVLGGALSKDKNYLWLHGDNGPVVNIRMLDFATQTLTSMGIGAGNASFVLGVLETPKIAVIGYSGTIYGYNYSLTAGLNTIQWTISSGVDVNSSLRPGIFDNSGHLWTGRGVGSSYPGVELVQIDPLTGAYAIHDGPINGLEIIELESGPVYDSSTNQIYVIAGGTDASDPAYLYAYSGWTRTPTADSGTWTRLLTFTSGSYLGRWMYYDPITDVLFMCFRATANDGYVYRYTGSPKVLVDSVKFSTSDVNADVYGFALRPAVCQYQSNYGYVGATASVGNAKYLVKLIYGGPEVLYDSEGNSLRESSSDSLLHNLADSYINYASTPTTTITGLDHLEGEDVVVWANGIDLGTDADYEQTYTVASGQITLPYETSNVTVGLPYYAWFKSAKLALQTQTEVLFGKERRVTGLALVLADTHAKGIRFGPDYDNLDERPETDGWAEVDPDNIDADYDADMIAFPSSWAADLRVCLKAQAPRPCTVLAVKLVIEE